MSSRLPPRGVRDLLPEEAAAFAEVESQFQHLATLYGFSEIRTPFLEYEETFRKGVGEGSEIVQKQMYRFPRLEKEALVLRPEGTAPCARAYLQHALSQKELATKWYYVGAMFRYERPQKGRERQFQQCGAECFGYASPSVEVELMQLAAEFLERALPQKATLLLNSVGCSKCRPPYEAKLKEEITAKLSDLCEDCQFRFQHSLLRIFDCKKEKCRKHFHTLSKPLDSLCESCKEHFKEVQDLLKKLHIAFHIEPQLVRGLDYYTKTTFEFVSSEGLTLLGGGRYDNLIEIMGGEPTPAAGFAAGVDRIVLALPKKAAPVNVWILPFSSAQVERALQLATKLRQQNISCWVDTSSRKISTRVKWASRSARFCIFLGEEEVAQEKVQLKSLETGEQKKISFPEALKQIQGATP